MLRLEQSLKVFGVLFALIALFFVSFGPSALAAGQQSGGQSGAGNSENNKASKSSSVKSMSKAIGEANNDAVFSFIQPTAELETGAYDYQDFDVWYKGLKPGVTYEIKMPDNIILSDFIIAKESIIESVNYKCTGKNCWNFDYTTLVVKTREDYSGSLVEGTFGASFENYCRIPGEYNFNWDNINNGLVINSNWDINFTLGSTCLNYTNSLEKYTLDDIELGTVFIDGKWNGIVSGLDAELHTRLDIGSTNNKSITVNDTLPTGWTYKDIIVSGYSLGTDGAHSKDIDTSEAVINVDKNTLNILINDIPEYSNFLVYYDVVIDGEAGFKTIVEKLVPDTFFCESTSTEIIENVVNIPEFNKTARSEFYLDYISENSFDKDGGYCIPWDDAISINNMETNNIIGSGTQIDSNSEFDINVSYDWITDDIREKINDSNYNHNWVVEDYTYLYDASSGTEYNGTLKMIDSDGYKEVAYSEEAWENFGNDEYVNSYIIKPASENNEAVFSPATVRINVGDNLTGKHSFKLSFDSSFENATNGCEEVSRLYLHSSASFGFMEDGGSGFNTFGNDFVSLTSYYGANSTCVKVDPDYNSLPVSSEGDIAVKFSTYIVRNNPSIVVEVDPDVVDLNRDIIIDGTLFENHYNDDGLQKSVDLENIKVTKIDNSKFSITFDIPDEITTPTAGGSFYIRSLTLKGLNYKGRIESSVKVYNYADGVLRNQGEASFIVSTLANELGVDKWVAPAGSNEWVKELDLGMNPISNKVDYLLDFSNNSSFEKLTVDVIDNLPANFTFEGFVVNGETVPEKTINVSGIEVNYDNEKIVINSGNIDNTEDLKIVFRGSVTGTGVIVNTVLDSSATVILSNSGSVLWNKTSPDGKLLGGSTFLLTGPDGYSKTVTSDTGAFVVSDLEFGAYTLKETKAPNGYILNSKVFEFNISHENRVINIGEIVNQPEIATVTPIAPTVKKNDCDVPGTVVIPSVEGIRYEQNTTNGKVIVKAYVLNGYVLSEGAVTEWTLDITPDECPKPEPDKKGKDSSKPKYNSTGENNIDTILGVAGMGIIILGGVAYYIARKKHNL